jgi:hypothetical protein
MEGSGGFGFGLPPYQILSSRAWARVEQSSPRALVNIMCAGDAVVKMPSVVTEPFLAALPPIFQVNHESETMREYLALIGNKNHSSVRHVTHPVSSSSIPTLTAKHPIATINSGTSLYQSMRMDQLVSKLDIPGLVQEYLARGQGCIDYRGNRRVHFGIAGQQNVGPPPTKSFVLEYYGVSMPRLLTNTSDPAVLNALQVGWEIGQRLGIHISKQARYKSQMEFAKQIMGSELDMWAGMSLCILPLKEGEKVLRHTDSENCPHFTAVLNVNFVTCIQDGEWSRFSCIFYMRKSVSDMLFRSSICKEYALSCDNFIHTCDNYRKSPNTYLSVEAVAKNHYETAAGSEGMLITIKNLPINNTRTVVSLALLSKASFDKQSSFLGPVAGAIKALALHHSLSLVDLSQILSLLGILCNIYVLILVLQEMQSATYHDLQSARFLGGGLVEFIIGRMVAIVGGINNGPGRRCQNFCNKNLPVDTVKHNWNNVMGRIQSWHSLPVDGISYAVQRDTTGKEISILGKSVKYAGIFSSHHIAHTASLLGLAPAFFLDHAVVSKNSLLGATSRSKKKKPKSTSKDSTKDSIILSSLTRYLQVRLNQEHLTESMAENILCEARRRRHGLDMYFPGQAIYVRGGSQENKEWCVVNPIMNSCGKLIYQVQKAGEHHIGMIRKSMDVSSTAPGPDIIIGTGGNNNHVPYEHLEIPRSFIDEKYPSLHMTILHAMAMRPLITNDHNSYMDRINAIDELHSMIELWRSLKGTGQVFSQPSGGNTKAHIPVAVQDPTDNKGESNRGTKRNNMVLNEEEETFLMLSGILSHEDEEDAYECNTRLEETQPMRGDAFDQTVSVGNAFELRLGQGGIVYRVYSKLQDVQQIFLPDEWRGFKSWKDFPSDCPVTASYTLLNDAHAAMTKGVEGSRFVPRIIMEHIPGRPKKKKKKKTHQESPNLVFFEVQILNQAKIMYQAELPLHAPNLGKEGCMIVAKIAETLGGVRVSKDVKDGWAFDNKEIAAQHLLLSALCVASGPKFLLSLSWRIQKYYRNDVENSGKDSFMLGFNSHVVDGSISYYLVNGEEDKKTRRIPLVIAIPPRNKKGKANTCFVRLL